MWFEKRRAPVSPIWTEALEPRQLLAAANPAGQLDPHFGNNGQVVDATAPAAVGVAVDSSNRTVVAGTKNGNLFVARYVNGVLDPTFGTGGVATAVDFGGNEIVGDVAVQRDGRVVVAASTSAGFGTTTTGVLVVRYNTDGTLDTTFNGKGFATANFGRAMSVTTVAIANNGAIVVGGDEFGINGAGVPSGMVVRLNGRGRFDTGFGNGGIARLLGGTDVRDLALYGDGRIVVVGAAGNGIGSAFINRLSRDGVVEVNFPAASPNQGSPTVLNGVAIDRDGDIVVVGGAANNAALVERFSPDGRLDPGFATGGVFRQIVNDANDFKTIFNDVAILSDGDILVGGVGSTSPNNGATLVGDALVARFNSTGTLDLRFGAGRTGLRQVNLGGDEFVRRIAVQSNGAVIAAGSTTAGGAAHFAAVRLTGDNGVGTTPGAKVLGSPILRKSQKAFTFTVQYTGTDELDASTFDDNDIIISGNGFSRAAAFQSVTFNKNRTVATVTYAVRGPNSLWTRSFNGTYSVHLQTGQVADIDGNEARGRTIGSITVRIPKATV